MAHHSWRVPRPWHHRSPSLRFGERARAAVEVAAPSPAGCGSLSLPLRVCLRAKAAPSSASCQCFSEWARRRCQLNQGTQYTAAFRETVACEWAAVTSGEARELWSAFANAASSQCAPACQRKESCAGLPQRQWQIEGRVSPAPALGVSSQSEEPKRVDSALVCARAVGSWAVGSELALPNEFTIPGG